LHLHTPCCSLSPALRSFLLPGSMEAKLQCTGDEPSKIPYQLLKQITNDFDKERILGSGSYGTVYKGVYENGGEIAVKILNNIPVGLDDTKFLKEFNNLRGLKHQNIVELVGFCNESVEGPAMFEGKQVTAVSLRTALCFEYVSNGSLHKYISG
uniref:Protein kinase domain-containing protein n=1 Tax=Aegilops tauschii subsp. strangulata TaxID=200361 RepID=A0A453E1F4_AEGTS